MIRVHDTKSKNSSPFFEILISSPPASPKIPFLTLHGKKKEQANGGIEPRAGACILLSQYVM